ncbi:type II secretion system protein [bacterium]|nr:type II secretion system protein [bacterium]
MRFFGLRPLNDKNKKAAFTLAEVLITIGVIGGVAAISLPTLLTNVQERVRKEQVRMAKYKLTTSTSKMNADGQMIPYENTHEFIKVLSGHYKIISECDNNNLVNCWPARVINIPKPDGTFETKSVSTIKTGADLQAIALGTKQTETRGIISGDGVSMILVFSPKCAPMEDGASQSWSTVDGKPETNATTNCISAIFDINGGSGPNRLGVDIRTLNSLYGAVNLGTSHSGLNLSECNRYKNKLGIKSCWNYASVMPDYWAGGFKACKDIGLNLPSAQTLANVVGAKFGLSDLGPYEAINCLGASCWNNTISRSATADSDAAITLSGSFWTSTYDSSNAYFRYIDGGRRSRVFWANRAGSNVWRPGTLCVAD